MEVRSSLERNKEIWEEYKKGKKQKELAVEYDMTQARVSQILKPFKQQEEQVKQ